MFSACFKYIFFNYKNVSVYNSLFLIKKFRGTIDWTLLHTHTGFFFQGADEKKIKNRCFENRSPFKRVRLAIFHPFVGSGQDDLFDKLFSDARRSHKVAKRSRKWEFSKLFPQLFFLSSTVNIR